MSLRKLNAVMGVLHLIQGIVMVFLSNVIENVEEFSPEIVVFFQNLNFMTGELFNDARELFVLPFGYGVASFLLVSSLFHFIIVARGESYDREIVSGSNRFRWYEYAISSSIMIALIATIFGVKDLASLLLIVTANAAMNIFGYMMELINKGKSKEEVNWEPFIWGSVVGLVPWGIILLYLLTAGNLDQVPWYAWAILATYFVSFNLFPVNMYFQYRQVGAWKDYTFGERVYVYLSLGAKSVLAWLVFFAAVFAETAISNL